MDRSIVVLDTETASVAGAPHLLEIGAVRVVDGEAVDQFQSLVRPQVPIEAEATAVHGITDDDVRGAPDARDVLPRFVEWLGDDWLAAHNARYDAGVLGFECVRCGLAPPTSPMLDTLKLARRFLADSPDHRLETLCQHLEIEVDAHHRALPDAVACWKVLEAAAERAGPPSATTAELLAFCGHLLTIASAAPRAPALAARLRPLAEACRSGQRVALIYGEPNALSRLAVSPRILFESSRRGYMEAECARSGLLKTYRLDRVRKVEACA